MYDIPPLARYPGLYRYGEAPIDGVYCYVIEHYGLRGYTFLIKRFSDGSVLTVTGDWAGNKIDILDNANEHVLELVKNEATKLYNIMHIIKLDHAQFFMAGDGATLVDILLDNGTFASPGMINDIFGKAVKTQKVLSVAQVDDALMDNIRNRRGTFGCDVILKPSVYKQYYDKPLYIEFTE